MSVAKEGKVLEQKKLLQPLLGTPEGTEMGCIIFFTSSTMKVYSNIQFVKSGQKIWAGTKFKLADLFKNIAKGTTDPRFEFISQVQTHILIKFHLQNLNQASTSKSQPNIKLTIKLAHNTHLF